MSVIGFRCFKDSFSLVVLQGTQQKPKVIAFDRFKFPKDLSWGGKLAWLRREILEIITKYDITAAGMKKIEQIARRKSLERSEVEGVIKEAVYSMLSRDCTARIKTQLRRDIKGFKQPSRYLERVLTSRDLGMLNNPVYLDSALAAIAELPD